MLAAGLLAAAAAAGGCAAVSWTVAQFAPPQKVDALYKPPKGKTILVFVDDIYTEVAYQPIKVELTDRLNDRLTKYKIAAATVPYKNFITLASAGRDFDNLTVAEAGRRLGADLVLYVHIDKFSLRDDEQSPLWHGQLQATIRIVDVDAGRLWPLDDPEGYAVPPVDLPAVDNSSAAYGSEVARQLAEEMAERIVNCFRDHTAPAQGTWEQAQQSGV